MANVLSYLLHVHNRLTGEPVLIIFYYFWSGISVLPVRHAELRSAPVFLKAQRQSDAKSVKPNPKSHTIYVAFLHTYAQFIRRSVSPNSRNQIHTHQNTLEPTSQTHHAVTDTAERKTRGHAEKVNDFSRDEFLPPPNPHQILRVISM